MELRHLTGLLALLAYYLIIVLPMANTVSSFESAGAGNLARLRTEVKGLEEADTRLAARIEKKSQELGKHFGTLRFTGVRHRTPLDSMLRAIEETCKGLGVKIASMAPIAETKTDILELDGVRASLVFPSEKQVSELLTSLRERGRSRNAMLHGLSLARQDGTIAGTLELSILRPRPDGNAKQQVLDLGAWLEIRRETEPYRNEALLQPRPAPPKPEPPKPATKPTASTTPSQAARMPAARPPPSSFSGSLLGIAWADGADAAVFSYGGEEQIVARGKEIGGWKLEAVHPNRVILQLGSSTSVVWFGSDEEHENEDAPPSEEPPLPPARPRGAPSLGFSGNFESAGDAGPPAPPYEGLRRPFTVSSVDEDGAAGRSGIRVGDRLLAVDGTPLRVTSQLLGARTRLAAGESIRLAVERNRSIIEVSLSP